jgi:hypothetical protein
MFDGKVPKAKHDQFYTHDRVVRELVSATKEHCRGVKFVIDFSAGYNEFAKLMGLPYKSYDIDPPDNHWGSIENQDWLITEKFKTEGTIIGLNPPFGRRSGLVRDFVTHASNFDPDYMALIVPHPNTLSSSIKKSYEIILSKPLPQPAFYIVKGNNEKQDFSLNAMFLLLKKGGSFYDHYNPSEIVSCKFPNPVTPIQHTVTFLVRTVGANAGRDVAVRQGHTDNWYLIRGKNDWSAPALLNTFNIEFKGRFWGKCEIPLSLNWTDDERKKLAEITREKIDDPYKAFKHPPAIQKRYVEAGFLAALREM